MRRTKFKRRRNRLVYVCDDHRHLICVPYSVENLHRMAGELEIDRCWFHKDHYDIPKKRIDEIMNKCKVIRSRKILEILKAGLP